MDPFKSRRMRSGTYLHPGWHARRLPSAALLGRRDASRGGGVIAIATTTLTRWSALASMLGGMLYGTFMVFHPANDASGAATARWVPVHVAWHAATIEPKLKHR